MRKIRRDQGPADDDEFRDFHDLGTFDEAQWIFQGPGVRADAQCRCAGLGPKGARVAPRAGTARQFYETMCGYILKYMIRML